MTPYTPRHHADVTPDMSPCGHVDCHVCPTMGGRHRADVAA